MCHQHLENFKCVSKNACKPFYMNLEYFQIFKEFKSNILVKVNVDTLYIEEYMYNIEITFFALKNFASFRNISH